MPPRERITTTVSTKGQIVLPIGIRRALRWGAGTRLSVENTPEGVLLKSAKSFVGTRSDDVFGSLARKGPPKSIEEMDEGVLAEAGKRHASD